MPLDRRPRRPDRPARRGAAPAQAPHVQFFLGDPQGYKGPEFRYAGGADGLRDDAAAAGVDLYVHAPYIVNVATTNNRIRIPSRKLLQQHVDAAASDRGEGADRPRRPRRQRRRPRRRASTTGARRSRPPTSSCPLLIENTAGGDNAMTRHLERIAGVWDAIAACRAGRPGRASASTPATPTRAATRSRRSSTTYAAITGRIDLVHCNDSRDDVRLRRRPPRQPRRRPDRPRPAGRGRARRRRAGRAARPRAAPTSTRRLRLAPRAALRPRRPPDSLDG